MLTLSVAVATVSVNILTLCVVVDTVLVNMLALRVAVATVAVATRNWLQARLSVYPPQNYLTSFKSNMQNICQKYLFNIIILHENPPNV